MIKIVPLRPEHSAKARSIHCHVFKEIGQSKTDWEAMKKRGVLVIVAVNSNNDVIGYAIYTVHKDVLHFNWLAVLPRYRQKGVGQFLIAAIINIAHKVKTIRNIEVHTRNRFSSALQLYLRNKFRIEGTYLEADGDLMIVMRYHTKRTKKK